MNRLTFFTLTALLLAPLARQLTADEIRAVTADSRVFHARAFGAKGDDVTDNTEATFRCKTGARS